MQAKIIKDWNHCFTVTGASDGIKNILKLLICSENGKKPGVMIPIPQYPLYSASLAEFDMKQIGYYLDEANAWGLDVAELQVTEDNQIKR